MFNVIILGIASFLTDVSAEMVYPLLPLYLTARLGATPAIVGIIEGIAESLASLLRVFSGAWSDRIQQRKPIAILGYSFSTIGKVFLYLSTSRQLVLVGRIGDRLGKGLRTAPRDALIADSTPPEKRGAAYGLHRALDTAGASLGVILAYVLFISLNDGFSHIFLLRIIMTTKFILIRHGQTEWNRGTERFRGRADVPLNEVGHAQAQKVAARLAQEKIAVIYASPMQRTIATAQPLANALKLPVQPNANLLDIDVGALEGMTLDEARVAFPEMMEKWTTAPGHAKFPKGESFKAMRTRIVALLDELAPKHSGETIALVTHRVVSSAMLCVVLGLDADALWRIHQDNACVNTFEKREHGWVVTLMNDTSHLGF